MELGELLDYTVLGNTVRAWGVFLASALAAIAVVALSRKLVRHRLRRLSQRTATKIDDFFFLLLHRTGFFFYLFVLLSLAASLLTVPSWVPGLAIISLFIQVGIWGNTAVGFGVERWTARRGTGDGETLAVASVMGVLLRGLVWVVLFLMVLDNLGIDITALIAGLGIGGIAVALAVQNVLGDLFASMSIVLDKPFVVGDFIIVGDLVGTVEHIGLKSTRVRALSGEQLIFSNADLLNSRIRNFKRMFERRVLFHVGVIYGTAYEHLESIPEIIRAAVEAQPHTRFDRSHFRAYGDSALDFETVYFVLVPEYNTYMNIQQAINLQLFREFRKLGIEFAFPTRTVVLEGRVQSELIPPREESATAS